MSGVRSIGERGLGPLSADLNFIGGERRTGQGEAIEVVYPATGEPLLTFNAASAAQLDGTLGEARQAFDTGVWRRRSWQDRAAVIAAAGELLAQRQAELVSWIVADNGKTVLEAQGDFQAAVAGFAAHSELCRRQADLELPAAGGIEAIVTREPVGVVAALAPYNAPLSFAALKLLPALAAGNSVVLKPSERAPLVPLAILEALAAAGLPAGTASLLHGRADLAASLCADDRVDMISLTGGNAAGTAVMRAAAATIKNLLLELGGKSAHIVLADADLEAAIPAIAAGIFRNSGQRCLSGSRLLVEEPVAEEVEAGVIEIAASLAQGDPFEPTTEVGTMIDEPAVAAVEEFLERAVEGAVEVAAGGRRVAALAPGSFFAPTVLTGADNDSYAARTEIFGPVLTSIRVADASAAIHRANDSNYGLAGGVWTQDPEKALAVARQLRAGYVWVNTYAAVTGHCPFGGYGRSGLGREAGSWGLEEYTELKSILVDPSGGSTAPLFRRRSE